MRLIACTVIVAAGLNVVCSRPDKAPSVSPPAKPLSAAPQSAPAAPSQSTPAAAQAVQVAPAAHLAQLPPMLDRELFFGDAELAGAQISPDGKFISFLRTHVGQLNIWVKLRDEPFAAARPLTADTSRPVSNYFWSRDGRFVLYVQDKAGDENYRVFAVDPQAKADATAGIPIARDLTPYDKVRAQILAVPKNTPGEILVGLNDRDPQFHDVYRIDLASGKRQLLWKNEQGVARWVVDRRGKLRIGYRMAADGKHEILRIDGKSLTPVYGCGETETCDVVGFHKSGRQFYLETNKGESDLARLALVDLRSGEETLVHADPEQEADLYDAMFSPKTDELIATVYEGDRLRIYPQDPVFARDFDNVRRALPDVTFSFTSMTKDEGLQIVAAYSDVEPGATYLYERKSGTLTPLFRSRPKLPSEHLAKRTPVHYTARDGVKVPGYLTIPQGVTPKNLPAVILPHGGPWSRSSWNFDGIAQFLANRGYMVLQPNFRGSAGYGKKFLNLGNGQWGTGTMQHDLSDGAKWLAEQGWANGQNICIMGGSYGGYATLAGLVYTPELYRCGVDIVGPSSLITLLGSLPPYWAPIRKMFTYRVGDPDNAQDRERLIKQSPLYGAKQITAPLLIIQGANDPRVKKAESDQMVAALYKLGRKVEYLLAPDEGHGFAGRVNRIAMFAAVERFLAGQLHGRYQTEMPAEIAKRLQELTVDVSRVQATPAVTVSARE